ncbi:MAG: peptide deformylase, partial [Deltaproteobacteria bacterium]|nr:peptide deformylase [Deltaproteobacteria bacterium]
MLSILKFPDPTLKKVSLPVENITGDTVRLVQDIVETMYAAPGVGLAAPQIGMLQRIIVIDIDYENPGKNLIKLVNPEIRRAEGELIWEEGCLSVADFTAEV